MAFQRPTLTELIDRTKADFESRLNGGGSLLRRSTAAVIARIHAGSMHLLYGFSSYMAKQVLPDTADSEFLRRWAAVWGVDAKPATYSSFNVIFTGTDTTSIPSGTELVRSDGEIYTTQATGTIASGTALVAVQAKTSGAGSVIESGNTLSLSSPIAGVDSTATVQSSGLVDGEDAEDDASLLGRLLDRIQEPPHGGAQNDYVQWAKEVAGVTRAWCYPLYTGAGTVGVTFVLDDNVSSIIPDGAKVTEVQTYIDDPSRRPVTADVTVFAPTASALNFTISGVSDATVRLAIQAELKDLIRRESEPGGTLLLSHINEAISAAHGETDHVLTSPSANVVASAGVIKTMGTITWV